MHLASLTKELVLHIWYVEAEVAHPRAELWILDQDLRKLKNLHKGASVKELSIETAKSLDNVVLCCEGIIPKSKPGARFCPRESAPGTNLYHCCPRDPLEKSRGQQQGSCKVLPAQDPETDVRSMPISSSWNYRGVR